MKTLVLLAAATLALGASYALNIDKAQHLENRIVNGYVASLRDMPYHVGLFIFARGSNRYGNKCGGALISSRVVLTAAHCFINMQQRGQAFLGTNRFSQGTRVSFSRVKIHENFNNQLAQNDIAIVYLDKFVQQNGSTIKFIRLDYSYLGENIQITVSGYGAIANGVGTDTLYYTHMRTRNQRECQGYNVFTNINMICAKGDYGREACQGDSGGPVVRNWPYNPTLVGVVSFGGGCQRNMPNVFTRISSYITWIRRNM